jgi:hypothetical protein
MGLALVVALAALVLAPSAQAGTTLVGADGQTGPQPYQRWVDEARVSTPDVQITLHLEGCPHQAPPPGEVLGCATQDPPAIWLPNPRDRQTLMHEIAHFFDAREMTARNRRTFRAIMKEGGRGWLTPQADRFDTGPLFEQFAEGWRMCARSLRWPSLYSDYDYLPTRHQHRKVCRLIAQAAR